MQKPPPLGSTRASLKKSTLPAILPKHEIKKMRLDALDPAPYNPREISTEAMGGLSESLRRFGLVQPIIWNKRSKLIVGGHQRREALMDHGVEEAEVVVVDLPPAEERALNITLNNPAVAGEFTDALQELLSELKSEMPETFNDLRLNELLSLMLNENEITQDEPPPVPKKAKTVRGDLISMGDHRLLCGDSLVVADVERLLDGKRPTMIFTDPPWNIAIGQDSNPRHRQRAGLINDDLGKDFPDFLHGWSAACLPFLDGDIYCVMGCGEWPSIDKSLRDAGMHWSATIVWVKDQFVLGGSNYHSRFEPIWYGWPDKTKSSYTGQRNLDDVWEFARPKVSEEHPTMKPTVLVAQAVNNSSKPGDLVFDPFTGSGTTLMACDQTKRRFVGIEIDPRYCDVIVKRWETSSGKKAKLLPRA